MRVLFIRHGESKSQAKLVPETEPDYLNTLTENGVNQVKESAQNCSANINAVYASPYTRTRLTAKIFIDTCGSNVPVITDERLHEIDYGNYSDLETKHKEKEQVALKQVAGDYEARFGRIGENKREIVTRMFDFLVDVFNKHSSNDTILAVTHGRVISITDAEFRIITKTPEIHGGTKNAQIKEIELNTENIEKIKQRIAELNSKTQ